MKKSKKVGLTILAIVGLILVLLVVYYHSVIGMIINNNFQKKIELETGEWTGGESYEGVQYSDISESDYVDIYVPSDVENPPLLVMVHGGGFIMGDSQSRQSQLVYQYYRSHGFAVASVNYRLAQEDPFPAAVQDVKACIRYLRANAKTYGYNAERIAIAGESAGGYLACMAAATSDEEYNDLPFIGEESLDEGVSAEVQVLVDIYGATELGARDSDWEELRIPGIVTSIANYWITGADIEGYGELEDLEDVESIFSGSDIGEMTEEERSVFLVSTYVERNWDENRDLHVYITHGDSDLTVPIQVSERFYEASCETLGEDRVTFHIAEKSGHAGERMYSEEELGMIAEFILENL